MSNTCSLNAQTLPKVLGIKLTKWDNRQNVPTTFHNFLMHQCISWDILSPGRKWDNLSDGTICLPKNASWTMVFYECISGTFCLRGGNGTICLMGQFVSGEKVGHFHSVLIKSSELTTEQPSEASSIQESWHWVTATSGILNIWKMGLCMLGFLCCHRSCMNLRWKWYFLFSSCSLNYWGF